MSHIYILQLNQLLPGFQMSNIIIYRGIQHIFFHTKLRRIEFRTEGMFYLAEFAILLFKSHFFLYETKTILNI